MKKINPIFLAAMLLTLNLCSEQESSPEKINNCFELADAIEEVFDTIQIEAYESEIYRTCLLYTSPSPRDKRQSRMPSSA